METNTPELPQEVNEAFTQMRNDFKVACETLDKLQEPSAELSSLTARLDHALNADWSATYPQFRNFLYEDLSPGIAKRLQKERSNDENYLRICGELLEMLVKHFAHELKNKRFSHPFSLAITQLFTHDCILHKYHYQIDPSELAKLKTQGQSWRAELGINDWVDVYVYADEKQKVKGWMQAQITALIDDDELYIEFPLAPQNYDGRFSRWSPDLVQFETKTKADYAWRQENLVNAVDFECDVHDKMSWNRATIFEVRKSEDKTCRQVLMAYCGLRIYRAHLSNPMRKDEKGFFDGWSNKFDEWVPVFTPRIQPFLTKWQKPEVEEIEDGLDDLVVAADQSHRIYAVPRPNVCVSSVYLSYINLFGNTGAFDQILEILADTSAEEKYQNLDINVIGALAQILTKPFAVYHKSFIEEHAAKICEVIKNRLILAPEKVLRDVRQEQINAIITSIDDLQKRYLPSNERSKQSEILRLQLCNKSLASSFLERRIQGMKDLSIVIKNNTSISHSNSSSQTFTTDYLIDWLVKNDVFTQIWDYRKTHSQLVQRSEEIFKLLLKEDKLDQDLLQLFWSLSKSDLQSEVITIVKNCTIYLRPQHIKYIIGEITNQNVEKLSNSEFDLLCELGVRVVDCKETVEGFFWKIVSNAANHKQDVVEQAISKYAEVVKQWELSAKIEVIRKLGDQVKEAEKNKSVLPVLTLMRKIIKDAKDSLKSASSAATSGYSASTTTQATSVQGVTQYQTTTASGSVLTSYSYGPAAQEESIYNASSQQSTVASHTPQESESQPPSQESAQLTSLLHNLLTQEGLLSVLINNLQLYCQSCKEKEVQSDTDRHKWFPLSKQHSHHDEVKDRLDFLRFIAVHSGFQFKREELRVIYDSLSVQSPIKSDHTEFLTWCQQCCMDAGVLEVEVIGEFQNEMMQSADKFFAMMNATAFKFLKFIFLAKNKDTSKIITHQKAAASAKHVTAGTGWKSYYITNANTDAQEESEQEEEDGDFSILVDPRQLDKLNMITATLRECKDPEVAKRAIDLLIKVHTSVDESCIEKRGEFAQVLIDYCIESLAAKDNDSQMISRYLQILRSLIEMSEKNGMGDVQPHSSILKGETLDRIIIKNASRMWAPNLVVKVYSSATLWEFVDKVSRMCDLAPQLVDMWLPNGKKVKKSEYGKLLGELGFKNNDIVTVKKNRVDADTEHCAILTNDDGVMVPACHRIISGWYDKYSNDKGVMTPESATRFILGATNENVPAEDGRIKGLFDAHDSNKDGVLEKAEFIKFYTDAAIGRPERVWENLKNHYIRGDLLYYSEIQEPLLFAQEHMPRYTLSHNQKHFETLLNLLDRGDDTSSDVWKLIRMLGTNQKIYTDILSMQLADSELKVDVDPQAFWPKFFASGSLYQQSYTQEIIEALMSDGSDQTNKVFFASFQDPKHHYNDAVVPKVKEREVHHENQALKENWTMKFLEKGGLTYILDKFAQLDEKVDSDKFKMQEIKFTLSVLKKFVISAIQADKCAKGKMEARDFTTKKMIELIERGNKSVLESIDFDSLLNKLLGLTRNIVLNQTGQINQSQKNIVANALALLQCCILYKEDLFEQFKNYPQIDQLIIAGLLTCPEEAVRQSFHNLLDFLARFVITQDVISYLVHLLSQNFNLISDYPSKQFFTLFNQVIESYYNRKEDSDPDLFDAASLLGQIITKIRFENQNKKDSQDLDDAQVKEAEAERENMMVGLLNMTRKIMGKVNQQLSEQICNQHDLINEIFKEFLFKSVFSSSNNVKEAETMLEIIQKMGPRKVKFATNTSTTVNKSRSVAFDLLHDLIQKSPLTMGNFIRNQLQPLFDMIKKPKQWNFTPPATSGRTQKYVGLRNLGCICYMNSMMQQFFMIPTFRYNLLCVEDGIPENYVEYKNESIDDNMLHQMQRLFAHLELSDRQDYNPLGFTFAFKEFDGQPTNIVEQKDAQEFLNVLFDRLENALKPTPRKYLLQSVFGGKTCSQIVCQSCGKVKNRMEDYYNLSLTVKDIKSVNDSLEKQVEGEIISGFKCDGCNKEVDVQKRTLITETPNVLIIHLQRIVFNFDTFQNDKLNQFFEFPAQLDLKPFSYHEVMKKEGLGKNKKKTAEEIEEELKNQQDGVEQKKEDDQREPDEDDCFEYKLVGVNVHSGSANAGHYWSQINTVRGFEEKDGMVDQTWQDTHEDAWMEFNDSNVKDFKYADLKEECFGDKPSSQSQSYGYMGYGGGWGGKYGKSGYMLFYERKKKKPIKIVVPNEQVTEEMKQTLVRDEEKDEWIKHISYREGVDNEPPNKIFAQVNKDNSKFEFENEVYSAEFFENICKILKSTAQFGNSDDKVLKEMRASAIKIAKKACFEILARCFYNSGIKDLVLHMIDIFQQDDQLVLDFTNEMLDDQQGEQILELLLDCVDSTSRTAVGNLWRWLIAKCKTIELEKLKVDHTETVCAKFLAMLKVNLPIRAAKAWSRFDNYLELFQALALSTPEEVYLSLVNGQSIQGVQQIVNQESPSESALVGIDLFFKTDTIDLIIDFVFGPKKEGDIQMGGTYSQPNFSALNKIIQFSMNQKDLVIKYNKQEHVQVLMSKKAYLKKFIEEQVGTESFVGQLEELCKENFKLSQKLSKIFLQAFSSSQNLPVYLKALKKFLKIKDSLQVKRLEWVFGVAQIKTDSQYRSNKYKYGQETIMRINDASYTYVSTLAPSFNNPGLVCLLQRIREQINRADEFVLRAIRDMCSLMIKDQTIAQFLYNVPPPTWMYSRYVDWFQQYIEEIQDEVSKSGHHSMQYSTSTYIMNKIAQTKATFEKFTQWKELVQTPFHQKEIEEMTKAATVENFSESALGQNWLFQHPDTIKHWPPQYIVGKQTNQEKTLMAEFEDELCKIQVFAVQCEWNYSNPTKMFNLSMPDKMFRTKNYTFITYNQYQQLVAHEEAKRKFREENAEYTQDQVNAITVPETNPVVREWASSRQDSQVIAQLVIENKHSSQLTFEVQLICTDANVALPESIIKETVFGRDDKVIAHFMKVDPEKPFQGQWTILAQNNWQPPINTGTGTGTSKSKRRPQQEVPEVTTHEHIATDADYVIVNNNNTSMEENYNGSNDADGKGYMGPQDAGPVFASSSWCNICQKLFEGPENVMCDTCGSELAPIEDATGDLGF